MAAKERHGLDGDIEKNCENCRFFAASGGESTRGDCRRHAPHPATIRLRSYSEQGPEAYESYWPVMSHDDWCGEFEPIDGADW